MLCWNGGMGDPFPMESVAHFATDPIAIASQRPDEQPDRFDCIRSDWQLPSTIRRYPSHGNSRLDCRMLAD